jgi:mycothiol synthase
MQRPQLRMTRPDLEDLEQLRPPETIRIRTYQPGDSAHWERIIATSFEREPGSISFDRVMRRDPAFRPERIFFAVLDGIPVATASAFRNPDLFPTAGTIHYVGTLPEARGRKLGYLVSLAALHRMYQEGLTAATLLTDDFRLAALKTYLRLGFEPVLVDENQRERWRTVFKTLGLPDLIERFAGVLDGPVWTPARGVSDEFDYRGQVVLHRRHNPERPVGRPQYGECDALADESLYHPAALGRAGCSITSVPAGMDRPFQLWFEAGAAGLDSGTVVTFHVLGQKPLGAVPQTADASRPGYVQVEYDGTADIKPGMELRAQTGRARPGALSFGVAAGRIRPGERVVLRIGTEHGFTWTPLAGRKEFKVMVDPGLGEPTMRLPEPVVVRVQPLEAHRLEVIVPATARNQDALRVNVTARDVYDNRATVTAPALLSLESRDYPIHLNEGRTAVTVPRHAAATGRAYVSCEEGPLDGGSNWTVAGTELELFVGDLHAHDITCAAEGWPMDVMQWARDEKALDFVSTAPQTHAFIDSEKWLLNKHAAEAYLEEGRFVTFPAFEWQHSHYGDKVVHYLGGDQPFLPVDDARFNHPAKLYEAVRASDALVISHHPGYALDQHVPGTDWDAMETDVDRLVELWSMHGSSEGYDPADRPLVPPRREDGVLAALRDGKRFGFTAGSDTHGGRPGGSAKEPRPYWGGLCAVWAKELTRRSLFEALWARRTVALTGARIVLSFTVNGAWMGSR